MAVRATVLSSLILAGVLAGPCLASAPAVELPTESEALPDPVTPPRAIAKTQKAPVYPPAAQAARFDGTVHLRLTIRPDGAVGNVEVLDCDHPNVGFEAASLDAVRQWKFAPALKRGEPVEYVTNFRISFRAATGQGPGDVTIACGSPVPGISHGTSGQGGSVVPPPPSKRSDPPDPRR